MTTTATSIAIPASENPVASATIGSVAALVQRITAEVTTAEQRVRTLRLEAARLFDGQGKRLSRFSAVADRLHSILQPRLKAFAEMDVFKDVKQSVSPDSPRAEGQGFHGRTVSLAVPYSDKRPAPMDFSFHVGHDSSLENAVMEYRLQIRPVFVEFEKHDQLVIPIDQPNEDAIAAWIDDKLVGFTRTYFEVYFHKEYQKQSQATDPVMNVRFPKAFAVARTEYEKQSYYFYTKESFETFENDPAAYAKAV